MGSNQTKEGGSESEFAFDKGMVKQLDETPEIDLCFMLDCTGSMGSYIRMACEKIKDIIKEVNAAYPQSDIRIGIVAYRDIGDNPGFQIFPFLNSAEKAKKFLDGLQASGGADAPEDINGAFQKTLFELKWEKPVRILVHIADAPCHGTEFHSYSSGDTYPKGHKGDMSWDKIFQELVNLQLHYLLLKINDSTDLMFTKFKAMAHKCGAIQLELNFSQEPINQSTALQAQASAAGEKVSAKVEDHFAATVAHTIKEGVHKEMKKGLATKLSKRVEENAELVNNIKKSVAETVSKLNVEELRSKYSGLAAKVGDCILSSNNFIDAIADEDCLCLTFDIGRSQTAIADPTQIIIKNVYPSFLTAGSFFYSTEYALKKNKLAHGGFEKHAEGLILKGAASENITGVMPLYFCEENWQVAKQLMKMTIAWDVTLDPLGYSYAQMKTVPFLILAKLAEMVHEKPTVEFLKFQFELVKRTCMKIMEDGSKEHFETKFNQEVINLYEKYVTDPSIRTIDSIANNSVFLAQLYIALENGGVPRKGEEYFDELFKGMLEEELRRKQKNFSDDFDTNEWLFSMLNVDVENHIAKPVQAYIDSQLNGSDNSKMSQYEQKFLKISSVLKPVNKESVTQSKDEKKEESKTGTTSEEKLTKGDPRSTELIAYKQSFTRTDGTYNDTQTKAREEYSHTLKLVMKYLYPLRMLFSTKPAENPTSFIEWDIKTDNQFFSLYIQNKLHSKNAGRREAITGGTYKNPWTQSEEFIQTWYNKLIENEKASRITKFVISVRDAKSALQANVFASTSNLNEAAGALLGTCVGVSVSEFWNKLCEGGYPESAEKVRMMVNGYYKGVKLYKDSDSWAPCRTNGNHMFRGNKKLFTPEQWVEVIPSLSTTFVTKFYDI